MRNAFPIIDRPDLQSTGRRWGYRLVTTVAWAIWFYLWLPAVTMLGWALGIAIARDRIMTEADLFHLRLLASYGVWVAVGALGFMLWSTYNKRRFTGLDRRRHAPRLKPEQVASDLPLSARAVQKIMVSRKVTIRFDEDRFPETAELELGQIPIFSKGDDEEEDLAESA